MLSQYICDTMFPFFYCFFFFNHTAPPEIYTFPYTTLFRSGYEWAHLILGQAYEQKGQLDLAISELRKASDLSHRSEEHTSELQSRVDLVCRLLLEKKKNNNARYNINRVNLKLLS